MRRVELRWNGCPSRHATIPHSVDVGGGIAESRVIDHGVVESLVVDLGGGIKVKDLLELLTDGDLDLLSRVAVPDGKNVVASTDADRDTADVGLAKDLTDAGKAEFLPETLNHLVALVHTHDPATTIGIALPCGLNLVACEEQGVVCRNGLRAVQVGVVLPEAFQRVKAAQFH